MPRTPKKSTIINNSNHDPKFEWKNDILWYKGMIYLNWKSKSKVKEIKESHDSPAVGHVRFFKYYYNGGRSFFFKLMQKYIQQYVAKCNKCQRNKCENILTPGLLQPLHIPNQKWEEISMDFIDGLPPSEGKGNILVVVDRLTKFSHFMAIKKQTWQNKLLMYFAKISTNYKASQKSLSATEMQNLMENFLGNFSNK